MSNLTWPTDTTRNNYQSWINLLWDALDRLPEEHMPEGRYDGHYWDDVATVMAWLTEDLGCVDPMRLEEINNG